MTNKIAIVGAGISGLTLGTMLQEKGIDVQVFDKGRGVGGRMSSRRTDWGYIDHGTQYFGLTNSDFRKFLNNYGEVLLPWKGKFATWEKGTFLEDNSTQIRYVPTKAMNHLCKYLGGDITVKLDTRIVKLVKKAQGWTLVDQHDNSYPNFDCVVITAPPAQTLDLLASHTTITEKFSDIQMLPCYSLMIIPEVKMNLPFDGTKFVHPVLGWVSNNDSKPLRQNSGAIVIQSNFNFAQNNLNTDKEKVTQTILEATETVFDIKFPSYNYKSLHLWRYALPAQPNSLQSKHIRYFACTFGYISFN